MRWTPGRRSGNVFDQRGRSGGFGGGGFGGMPFPVPVQVGGGRRRGGIGCGGLVVMLFVVFVLPRMLSGGAGFDIGPGFDRFDVNGAPGADSIGRAPDAQAQLVDFVSFVFDDVQQSWRESFRQAGRPYEEARLVIFSSRVRSGCGDATSGVGPFYCPADRRVYLDLSFFRELVRRFNAPGDFAQAYVIAHEVGHHVQNVLGISGEVQGRMQDDPGDANELSIRLELQADCLAGVWAYTTYERGLLEEGDMEEGLTAAEAVGDDRIQEQATGRIDRESWTHGSAEQRRRWFLQGYERGSAEGCDTFGTDI